MSKKRKDLGILGLVVVAFLLAGCAAAKAEPTTTPLPPTPTFTPIPLTFTPSPVPPTSTATPIPPTLTPTPKSLVITSKEFKPEDCQSNTVLEINNVDNKRISFKVKEGSLKIQSGGLTIWCVGMEHIWIGKLNYADHTFDSSADDPLRFLLVGGAYKYNGGAGTVTLPDGTQINLP